VFFADKPTPKKETKIWSLPKIIGAVMAVFVLSIILVTVWPKIEQAHALWVLEQQRQLKNDNCHVDEEQKNAREIFC
jgi:hypothetical protein